MTEIIQGVARTERPTMELRFILRELPRRRKTVSGKEIIIGYTEARYLQQKWLIQQNGKFTEEWRDVPIVEEGA